MNAQTRNMLIQELNNLKIELDRANKFKNQTSELSFTVTEDPEGRKKLFATTGSAFKLLLQKRIRASWKLDSSNQYTHLGNWLSEVLEYEIDQVTIK